MKRIAILATNGFEESELKSPKEAMENAGFNRNSKLPNLETNIFTTMGNLANAHQADH